PVPSEVEGSALWRRLRLSAREGWRRAAHFRKNQLLVSVFAHIRLRRWTIRDLMAIALSVTRL
ncbi:MAG TPA: hypothetical protein VJA25_01880, partial [Dehalococcoidia bacterium]|nr:hypothetical protein [Dehalococcoidia bacterium]